MICKLHRQYEGKRKPTTKKTKDQGCTCHEWWKLYKVGDE